MALSEKAELGEDQSQVEQEEPTNNGSSKTLSLNKYILQCIEKAIADGELKIEETGKMPLSLEHEIKAAIAIAYKEALGIVRENTAEAELEKTFGITCEIPGMGKIAFGGGNLETIPCEGIEIPSLPHAIWRLTSSSQEAYEDSLREKGLDKPVLYSVGNIGIPDYISSEDGTETYQMRKQKMKMMSALFQKMIESIVIETGKELNEITFLVILSKFVQPILLVLARDGYDVQRIMSVKDILEETTLEEIVATLNRIGKRDEEKSGTIWTKENVLEFIHGYIENTNITTGKIQPPIIAKVEAPKAK